MSKQITITLPENIREDLDKISELRASSVAQEIRTACIQHINDTCKKLDIDTNTSRKIESMR